MYEFLEYLTQDVMTREPVAVAAGCTIAEAERIFDEHRFNGLPVVDDAGALLGIVTKLDLLKAFAFTDAHMFPPYEEITKSPVSAVMTTDVQTVRPRTPLTRVLEKLVATGAKSFPVVDRDRLVGIVSREDVVGALRRAAQGEKPPRDAR